VNGPALRGALPGILLATCVLLPFHEKAFTIDDTFFLRGARQAAVDPLHPAAFDIVWFDAPERAGPSFGPLVSWILVPAILSPRAETVAHVTELLLAWVAILATVSLGLRLGLGTIWAAAAGLLLAASPTVLAMTGTAMADVPAMALAAIGIERLVAWRDGRRLGQGVAAAVALGLAPLARPHAVLVLGVGFLFLVGDVLRLDAWRRVRVSLIFPLFGAFLVTAGLLLLIRDPSPGAPGLLGAAGRQSSLASVGPNLVAYLTHWVLALPLGLPWLLLRGKALARWWWLLPAGAGLAYLALNGADRASIPNAAAAAAGLVVLVDVIAVAVQRRDSQLATLWVWLLLPLIALPYSQFPAKLNLLAMPAAALVVAKEMFLRSRVRSLATLVGVSVIGVALGIAILRADAAFASLGRRAATEVISTLVAQGHRVWFVGHWGFQWYAEEAGATPVTVTPPFPRKGDFVVICQNCNRGTAVVPMLLRDFRIAPVSQFGDSAPGGRVMTEGAGFFSNNHGYLPWTWGTAPLEAFFVGQVVATRLPETPR
jgi:hypothetical protein